MKKYGFFKYFIKNGVFAGGGGAEAGRPVPIGSKVGCSIFTPNIVWRRMAGAWKREQGCSNPPPTRPVFMPE